MSPVSHQQSTKSIKNEEGKTKKGFPTFNPLSKIDYLGCNLVKLSMISCWAVLLLLCVCVRLLTQAFGGIMHEKHSWVTLTPQNT